jgi:hypothetical protein
MGPRLPARLPATRRGARGARPPRRARASPPPRRRRCARRSPSGSACTTRRS